MKRSSFIKVGALALCLAGSGTLQAEDIDLFRVRNSETIPPNILIVIDNAGNWSQNLGSVKKWRAIDNALIRFITNPDNVTDPSNPTGNPNHFRIGIMHYNHSNPPGGIVMSAVRMLDVDYSSSLALKITSDGTVTGSNNLPTEDSAVYALSINEAYRYFKGLTAVSGYLDHPRDFVNGQGYIGYDPAAFADETTHTYLSPVATGDHCARNVIIFIGTGRPASNEDGAAEAALRALGGVKSSDPIALTPNNFASNWSDEYARFMHGVDFDDVSEGTQGITTYTINVTEGITTPVDDAADKLLISMAEYGKGVRYMATQESQIDDALSHILAEVLADNSVFASSTLPVSVNVRGTNLNQVYMGVFRPDENWKQRWMGNIKLYKLALDENNNVYLSDADGNRAEDTQNGFIRKTARSFWTHDSSFWDFNATDYPDTSDNKDGNTVEKGAAAQQIREDVIAARARSPQPAYKDTRYLYTCTDVNCGTLIQLDGATATTATKLGLSTTTTPTATNLVNWVYGARNNPSDGTAVEGSRAVRASVHGDVLHSRPAVISYTNSDTNVYAYYGGNDGIFHAIRGGTASTDGHERWGFVPYELLPRLRDLYDNRVITPGTYPKPYFMDGPIGVRRDLDPVTNTPTLVNLYVGLRRGGRSIYALNVSTEPPANPSTVPFSVRWRKAYDSSTAYNELGQTWSEPRVGTVSTSDTTTRKLVFFGGGYDPDFDDQRGAYPDANADGSTTVRDENGNDRLIFGRNLYAVDADSGTVVWDAASNISSTDTGPNHFEKVYPIPSDLALVDVDKNGTIDRFYVGDTGGNVWRVITVDHDPANWQVKKIASFGSDQKFLYPPDVVKLDDGTGYAVLIGSGDREDPKNERTDPQNRFYMFKDTYMDTTTTDTAAVIVRDDLQVLPSDPNTAVDLTGKKGWYMNMNPHEKGVSSSVTLNGVTFFNTNQFEPGTLSDPTSCRGNLGIARVYAVNYLTGTGFSNTRDTQVAGGGLQPSPVAAMVELTDADGHTHLVETVIVGPSPFVPPGPKLGRRLKTYWYKDLDSH